MPGTPELSSDNLAEKIERAGSYVIFMLNTFCCLVCAGGGYFIARSGWSSDRPEIQLWCALFAAALFVCAYECFPTRKGPDGRHRFSFPLGNPTTPLGALANVLFYASCAVMQFNVDAEEPSWLWTSGTILMTGLVLYFAWQLVWLLRKRRPQMAEH